MNKVALFDFCETLANFQTADAYVRYVMRKHNEEIKKGVAYWLQILMEKTKCSAVLFRLGFNVNKFMLLNNLRGLSENVLANEAKGFYNDIIKPNLIKETITELRKCKEEGFSCIIVSGGYDVYLRCFVEEYGIDKLLCSRLKFVDGTFSGKLDGKDCMNEEKVARLKILFGKDNLKDIDSVSYSDSKSDLPFLNYTKKAVVVSNRTPKWAKNHKFDILLWQM